MSIVLLTKKLCKFYILQLKLIIFSLFSHFFAKNRKGVKMTTIFKYFMFGKYGCLDTNARDCCMHVFLVNF